MVISKIQLGEIDADVCRKDIKNVHLSVHPPTGHVTISAPTHMKLETVRVFAISKLDWIKKQQRKIREQDRETPREFRERESHFLWGKRYLLTIEENDAAPEIELKAGKMVLFARPKTTSQQHGKFIAEWYRTLLKEEIPPLIRKWETEMGVRVDSFAVRRMKTKWGSCNPERKSILLNLELAKKPKPCLEYLVVHEMAHLIEPTHNDRFYSLMDLFMPNWEHRRSELNQLPVRHENWKY